MTATVEELKKYELMLIVSGELPEAQFEKELADLRKFLQESTKGISCEDLWGRRDMAYRVKKQARAYYVVFDFTATPNVIAELRANIKLNPVVLRHLLISLPDDYEASKYKDYMLPELKSEEGKKRMAKLSPVPRAKAAVGVEATKEVLPKPTVAGKEEEEQLKTVEKKLEQILENPDIDIK